MAQRIGPLAVLEERALAVVTEAFAGLTDAPLVRLGYLARIQSGITVDGGRGLSGNVVTRPYLRVANVQSGFLNLDDVTEITVPQSMAAGATLQYGDVLMTEVATRQARQGRGLAWTTARLSTPEPRIRGSARKGAPAAGISGLVYERGAGANALREHWQQNHEPRVDKQLEDQRLASTHPGAADQDRLCRDVSASLDSIDALRSLLLKQLALASARKQALVTAAVTGQFDVTTGREA